MGKYVDEEEIMYGTPESAVPDGTACQCRTCEQVFAMEDMPDKISCPNCGSGNWVMGFIDDNEEDE